MNQKKMPSLGGESKLRIDRFHYIAPLVERVRRDVSAIKLPDGSRWTREPLTDARVHEHLTGGAPRGACPILEGQSTTRLALFDLDSHGGEVDWPAMAKTARNIADTAALLFGLNAAAFRSSGGRGIHLFFIWSEPQDAHSVRRTLTEVLAACGLRDGARGVAAGEVEVFPKQDEVPVGGHGNQFILPLAGKSVPLNADMHECSAPTWSESAPVHVVERPARVARETAGVESLPRVEAALFAIPNEHDYDGWLRMLFAVREATGGSDEGLALFERWSAQCDRHDEAFLRREWARHDRPGVTRATLFAEAVRHGWQAGAMPSAEGFEDVDQLAQLRAMPPEQVRREWVAQALEMSPTDAADLLAEVHRRTGIGKRALAAELKEAQLRRQARALSEGAGGRRLIAFEPHDTYLHAIEAGRLIVQRDPDALDLVLHADRPARITIEPPPFSCAWDDGDKPAPDQVIIRGHNTSSLTAAVEHVAIFARRTSKGPLPIAVPGAVIGHLLNGNPAGAPIVRGLTPHPFATHRGEIVSANGLHGPTGLFVHGCGNGQPLRPFSRAEAAEALARLRTNFLDGFEFASRLDVDVAVSALLCGMQRPLLDIAPAVAILAAQQSSGKTTLARRLHIVLTGRDAPVSTLRLGDAAEIEKALLAVLLTSPAMLVFDNVPDGLTLHLGPLNAALTSATFEGRLLGSNTVLRASTATCVVFTGNNLRLGADETSRILTCRLAPATARAETRKFRRVDVLGHAIEMRAQAMADALGIVAGYLQSGDEVQTTEGSRFPAWDRQVRQSLLWAGGCDVAACFTNNAEGAEHLQALRVLLAALRGTFGAESFSAREVVDRLALGFGHERAEACDALEALGAKSTSAPKSVGRVLTAVTGRSVDVGDAHLRLESRVSPGKMGRYTVSHRPILGF